MRTRSIKLLCEAMDDDSIDFESLDEAVINLPREKGLRSEIEDMMISIIKATQEKGETPSLAFAMCTSVIAGAKIVIACAQESEDA